MHDEGWNIKDLSKVYNISKGVLYSIRNDDNYLSKIVAWRNVFRFKANEEELVVNWSIDFLENHHDQFNVKNVHRFVEIKLGNKYPSINSWYNKR